MHLIIFVKKNYFNLLFLNIYKYFSISNTIFSIIYNKKKLIITISKLKNNYLSNVITNSFKLWINARNNQDNNHISNGEFWLQKQLLDFNCETIFDIGASQGEWSLRMSKLFPFSKIYAFEPIYESYTRLMDAINSSEVQNICPVFKGIATITREEFFYQFKNKSIFNSQYDRQDIEDKVKVKVSLINGDDFCEVNKIFSIDFIKVYFEGSEMDLLLGFRKLLNDQKIYVIQFE